MTENSEKVKRKNKSGKKTGRKRQEERRRVKYRQGGRGERGRTGWSRR